MLEKIWDWIVGTVILTAVPLIIKLFIGFVYNVKLTQIEISSEIYFLNMIVILDGLKNITGIDKRKAKKIHFQLNVTIVYCICLGLLSTVTYIFIILHQMNILFLFRKDMIVDTCFLLAIMCILASLACQILEVVYGYK